MWSLPQFSTLTKHMPIEKLPGALVPGNKHERQGIQADHIPQERMPYPQWVCWRYVDRGEGRKPDKQPVNPHNLANAGVHWANTWTTFDVAYATYLQHCKQDLNGIGFVLTTNDPYVAVDIDGRVQEVEIEARAAQIIEELKSYTEISPSGRGIRILLVNPEFLDNVRTAAIEIHSHNRYVTITGNHIDGTLPHIAPVSSDLIASVLPPSPEQVSSPNAQAFGQKQYSTSDMELWERIFAHDKYGHSTCNDLRVTVPLIVLITHSR